MVVTTMLLVNNLVTCLSPGCNNLDISIWDCILLTLRAIAMPKCHVQRACTSFLKHNNTSCCCEWSLGGSCEPCFQLSQCRIHLPHIHSPRGFMKKGLPIDLGKILTGRKSSSSAKMYIAPCPARLATCVAVHWKWVDTDGMNNVLQPPPVLCRNRNGKLGSVLLGFEKTDRISSKISSLTMAEVKRTFPSRPPCPRTACFFFRGIWISPLFIT